MFWLALAIIAIAGYIIYLKRKKTVTISLEHAKLVADLAKKEQVRLANEMQDIVDKGALQGKTIAVDDAFKTKPNMSPEVIQGIKNYKQEILKRYGPHIPVNTAHRLLRELEDKEQLWNEYPGCFERHLQRRDGNLLFPFNRRIVIRTEIEEAREKDEIEQDNYFKKIEELRNQLKSYQDGNMPIKQTDAVIKQLQAVMKEAAEIGGKAFCLIPDFEKMEEDLIKEITKVVPSAAKSFELLLSYAVQERIPYLVQTTRKDTPITQDEQVPTLLSEDISTIEYMGFLSRSFAPEFRPNEKDIKNCLNNAVTHGFDKDRADELFQAWNRRPGVNPS